MNEDKIRLPDGIVKIVNMLPWDFPENPCLPDLLVEQTKFAITIDSGIKTCQEFLDSMQNIEENIEKNIPGITNFYLLTESKDRPIAVAVSGMISTVRYNPDDIETTSELKEEIISFYIAMVALEKTRKLKIDTRHCASSLGSIKIVSGIGKLYGKSDEMVYYADKAIHTECPKELLPIQQPLWSIFAKISIMNEMLNKVKIL